jgi:hypothetical protein
MRISRLLAAIGGMLVLLNPESAWMQVQVPTTLGSTPCIISGLNQFCILNGAASFGTLVVNKLFPLAQMVFLAIAMLLFAMYGIRLMLESGEESTISEVKSAYAYGITGAAIVSMATWLVQVVGQPAGAFPGTGLTLVNTGIVSGDIVPNIVGYIRDILGVAVGGVVVYQAIHLILSQGKDEEMEQQKKRFLHALIGVAAILLANIVVTDFIGHTGSSDLALQIAGIVNFLLVILGGLCVLAFIVAGVFLVVSTDEELKERAKKTIFATTVAIIVVLCVFAIITFVFGLTGNGPSGT